MSAASVIARPAVEHEGARVLAQPLNGAADHATSRVRDLAALRQILRRRRLRANHFPQELFADPAWDILLDLYIAHLESVPVSVTNACIASGVPVATGFRWLMRLQGLGLVERAEDKADGRRVHVSLTERGVAGMREWLETAHPTR